MDCGMWLAGLLLSISTSTLVAEEAAVKEVIEMFEDCNKETGFDGTLFTIENEGAPKEAKCFLACLMEKKGVMPNDGVINREKARSLVLKEYPHLKDSVFKVIDECVNEVNSKKLDDKCEKAYVYVTCRRSKLGIQTSLN